jgi:hypothetical protein
LIVSDESDLNLEITIYLYIPIGTLPILSILHSSSLSFGSITSSRSFKSSVFQLQQQQIEEMNMHGLPALQDDSVAMDCDYVEHRMLWGEGNPPELSSMSPVDPASYSLDAQEFFTSTHMHDQFTCTPHSPTDPRAFLSPDPPHLAYPCSDPWPNQGPVARPPSHGPSYTEAQGLSPIVEYDPNLERILLHANLRHNWEPPDVPIFANPTVGSTKITSKQPRKTRFPRTIEEFKARRKPLCKMRDTRGFSGVGKNQNRQHNGVSTSKLLWNIFSDLTLSILVESEMFPLHPYHQKAVRICKSQAQIGYKM